MSSGGQFGSNNPFRRNQGAVVNPATSSGSDLSFGLDGATPPPTASTRVPHTTFKSAVPEDERRDEEEQPVQQKPKKIVKKVRVQSPPPSSPEDAVPVTRFPPIERLGDYDDEDSASQSSKSDDQAEDPFGAGVIDPNSRLTSEPPLPQIPPNPFARTLQDIERRGQAHDVNTTDAATSASKGSLDVDSFKRLLLTGYANLPTPGQSATDSPGNLSRAAPSQGALPDGGSATDTSSVSKQSIFDALHDTPRTSHEISESEASEERRGILPTSPLAAVPSASARKKPPPPSSRHGKLIKIDLGAGSNRHDVKPATPKGSDLASPPGTTPLKTSSDSDGPQHSPQGTTNINKPLPEPPVRASMDEDVDSPFDREAAGKVPEAFAEIQAHPRPPTPPPTARSRSGSQTSTQSRKPAAPPPRRHGRSDSKISSHHHPTHIDEDPPRSSMESNRSRPESLRISSNPEKPSYAPAPPPPRRPGHSRQDSSFIANPHASFSPAASPAFSEKDRGPWGSDSTPLASPGIKSGSSHGISVTGAGINGQMKLSPPPPPPTRKQSTRRPASVRSMEIGNGLTPLRKASREKDGMAPPPPPPPPRARGSRPASERKGSVGSIVAGNDSAMPPAPTVLESGNGDEILADLDALQREVDELMKKGGS
ncbi:hypothetical protein F5B22DRAFT_226768 [Xylaria bambusicola]|uniref:uncharacterized protein n=1 Tax=Xylaria bambusicola TaxID=326684 RepID=UPI0020082823|nr:uncharacterized protein F5B22DRAFT_226768 [Xylaria bambusicola]KAI0514677.1 hypothetical protein F5B22DRAFT_226768 [Xylaria bambusicola]